MSPLNALLTSLIAASVGSAPALANRPPPPPSSPPLAPGRPSPLPPISAPTSPVRPGPAPPITAPAWTPTTGEPARSLPMLPLVQPTMLPSPQLNPNLPLLQPVPPLPVPAQFRFLPS